jgi:hypothetical protein
VIKRLDLISQDTFDMTGMTYAGMTCRQINTSSSLPYRQLVADSLGIPVSAYALGAMEWLGLFSEEPMNRTIDSTFEVTSDLMISKMGLGPGERDMVALQHTFLAAYPDGR